MKKTKTMMTMRRARRMAPASPTQRDERGRLVQARTLTTPFRRWARGEFASWGNLSPKLARIVRGCDQ